MKTRLYTRKRALISSVAMLLVAMIALGTATFAWFTQNLTVDATGLKAKASASVGLKILSNSQATAESLAVTNASNYKTSTVINAVYDNDQHKSVTGQTMNFIPASIDPTSTASNLSAFTTQAANSNSYARATDATAAQIKKATAGTEFYKERIYVTLTGNNSDTVVTKDLKLDSVDLTTTANAMSAAVCAVVVYHDGTANSDTVVAKVNATDSTKSVNCLTAEKAVGATMAATPVDFDANGTGNNNVGEVSSDPSKDYFEIYVYLDGEDALVKSDSVLASDILSSIELNCSITADA